jgi:hypothetical protein
MNRRVLTTIYAWKYIYIYNYIYIYFQCGTYMAFHIMCVHISVSDTPALDMSRGFCRLWRLSSLCRLPSRLSRPQDIRKAFWNRPGVIKKSWYM